MWLLLVTGEELLAQVAISYRCRALILPSTARREEGEDHTGRVIIIRVARAIPLARKAMDGNQAHSRALWAFNSPFLILGSRTTFLEREGCLFSPFLLGRLGLIFTISPIVNYVARVVILLRTVRIYHKIFS